MLRNGTEMKSHYNTSLYISLTLVALTVLAYGALAHSATGVSATTSTVSSKASVNVASACTMSATGDGSYSVTMVPGGDAEITSDPIAVSCNDGSGYALYAIGYSGDSYSGSTHTDLIYAASDTYNIKTSGTSGASYWKMKLANLTNATIQNSYDGYQVIPASFTKVAQYDSTTTSGSLTPTYQIHASTTQVAGTYTGKVKYTLVHPSTMVAGTYNIAYNANGGTGSTSSTTGVYNFDEVTLPNSTFTAPSGGVDYAYKFAGWCTTNTAGSYACDGTSYAAGATVTSLATAGSTATLYAYWEEIPKVYIQDLTLTNCPAEGMTVYDKRDGNDYTVKLINGQCWMTQNLRYLGDTGSSAGTMTIGNNNSNVANKDITLYSLKNGDAQSFNAYSSDTCGNSLFATYIYACVYDSGNTSTGVWYNYYAASAGTISGSSNSTAATSDICPAGWHLPSGPNTTANTDLNKLVGNTISGYQAATSGLTAFSAVAGGYYDNGSLSSTVSGFWWSATALSTAGRYHLVYNSSDGQFRGEIIDVRYRGNFVRCVRSS